MTAEERLANDPTSELWGEHRSRYRFAAGLMGSQPAATVLDVASGSGFGLRMLRQAGARPIGLDYDPNSLDIVRQLEPRARLIHADATCLPLSAGALDMVVSFETIEHVPNAAAMVAEIRRVLRPGGVLVLSTPNKDFGPPERHTGNPFHIQEFTADELRTLLCRSFDEVQLYGQRPSPAYRYVPFRMVDPHQEPSAIAWKLLTRLPYRIKNQLALGLGGRPFYPSESDYQFTPGGYADAHALVAVAR